MKSSETLRHYRFLREDSSDARRAEITAQKAKEVRNETILKAWENGLTQTAIAAATGLTQQQISNILANNKERLNASTG